MFGAPGSTGTPVGGTSAGGGALTGTKSSADWAQIIAAVIAAYSAYSVNKSSQSFASRMSDTAHQREVRDLRLAGLNPILSQNRGASTPTPALHDPGKNIVAAASAFQQQKQLKAVQTKQIENLTAQTRLTNATASKTEFGNIKLGVTATPWQMITELMKSGEFPASESAEDIKGVVDLFGTTSARPKLSTDQRLPWKRGRNKPKPYYIPQNRRKAGELLREHRRKNESRQKGSR